jgi:hypothetical protein
MPEQMLAVAIHRWFADREDWAYHTSLRDHLPALIDAVDRELKARGEGAFVTPWPYGWLVGERLLDRDCLNVDAAKRLPTVFRVAYLPQEPTERDKASVLAALRQLALPNRPGPGEALLVSFEAPPTLPEWPRARAASGGFLGRMFSAVGQPAEPDPMTGPELARRLEGYWRFHLEAGSAHELFPLLAEKWRGVTAAGRVVRRSDFTGMGRARPAEFPALLPGRDRVEVLLDGGLLVVTGEPLLRDQPVQCVHVYALRRELGKWEMITATVTPLALEAVAVPVSSAAWPPARPASPAAYLPPRGGPFPAEPPPGEGGGPNG